MIEMRVLVFLALVMVDMVASEEHKKMAECIFNNTLKGKILIHFKDGSKKDTMFMGNISNLEQGKHGFNVYQVTIIQSLRESLFPLLDWCKHRLSPH